MSTPPLSMATSEDLPSTPRRRCSPREVGRVVWTHLIRHTGVGITLAVAYFDPGNWSVDLQAGSDFGYKLLFIVLLAGFFAVFLQSLACKMGIVTGLDLAAHCRLLLHSRTQRPKLFRWLTLYPLYVFSEIAIIATDLAELLGSAIALNILFPKLPLWAGVLLTASDVFLILAFGDPLRKRPVKVFELLIGVLVLITLVCMCIIISRVNVEWGQAFLGYVPSKTIFQSGGLYTSVGILGATVMPHSIFLGSALATQDRVSTTAVPFEDKDEKLSRRMTGESVYENESALDTVIDRRSPWRRWFIAFFGYKASSSTEPQRHSEWENNTLDFIRAHLRHAIVNIITSLLGIAVVINSLILILASAVFRDSAEATSSLFDAADLIGSTLGHGLEIVFALALLAAGQSASLVATVAGQIVSEGFLRWKVSPIFRRFLTRLLGLIPSMVVAIAAGRNGIDTMLVASQVALSLVLPFIIFPLILITSTKSMMRVRVPASPRGRSGIVSTGQESNRDLSLSPTPTLSDASDPEGNGDSFVEYSNSWLTVGIALAIWGIIVAANCYVIVSLILGNEG
ncbi:unnamed protein product [Peniophora sp. CBMAI 1063]|nr:unnamed protein product [Peniophora sp. CBMAI 1063]